MVTLLIFLGRVRPDRTSYLSHTRSAIVMPMLPRSLPRSRRFLAVPFVGKDAPSPSSEYAHPDVAIGLSTLAYRYEGLRYAEIAERTGGQSGGPADLQKLIGAISLVAENEVIEERFRLWSNKWWGGAIVFLLVVYWVSRKVLGLI